MITVKGLKKSFGQLEVLKGIDQHITPGEKVVIIGPSGSGKSTFLRCLNLLERPTEGQILFEGTDITDPKCDINLIRRRMGMLFQFGALFTDLSVFDNVAFPLREQTDLDEETIRDLVLMKLDAVGLRGAARLMPSDISGGMARRVALARAIALDPDLIMYDEPFAGLDPISMGVTAQLIRSLNDALGATAIIVTHDVAETFAIADYVYMVNAGRISAEGTPAQLSASDDPYVRQFLDAQPDGPVRFHYPADPIDKDFGVRTK